MFIPSTQQIQYFLTIAETKSFTKAAKELFIAQPTLSKWITILERELDTKLFIRTSDGVILTKVGEHLYVEWSNIFHRLENSVAHVANQHNDGKQELKIDCLDFSVTKRKFEKVYQQYREKYSEVKVNFELCNNSEIFLDLVSGNADIGIAFDFSFENVQGLLTKNIEVVTPCFAISKSNPLAAQDNLALSQMIGKPLYLVYEDICPMSRYIIYLQCAENGFFPKEVIDVKRMSTLLSALKHCDGFSFLVSDGLEIDESIKQYPLNGHNKVSYISVAYLPGRQKQEVASFLKMLPQCQ